MTERNFTLSNYIHFKDSAVTRTEVVTTEHSKIAVWSLRPGQSVDAHIHPNGQDTYIVLKGSITYLLGNGEKKILQEGDMDIADANVVHGARNESGEDAAFVSIHSSPDIGFAEAKE